MRRLVTMVGERMALPGKGCGLVPAGSAEARPPRESAGEDTPPKLTT